MALNSIENLLKKSQPHRYIFEFECDVAEYIALHPIERFFTYIATESNPKVDYFPDETILFAKKSKETLPDLADCDGSGRKGNNKLIHEVYTTLFGWRKGRGTFGAIEGFYCQFGGETMNSMFYPICDIAGDTIKEIPKTPIMTRYSKNHFIDYFVQKETNADLNTVLQNTDGLIDYLNSYHTIGNFTLVPAGFNGYRGMILRDYWDDSLRYLLENGFESNSKNSAKFDKNEFTKFVNSFFFWDYIDIKGQPKCLNPKNDNLNYFRQTSRYIYRRGLFMIAMLRLNVLLGEEKYKEIRKNVFGRTDRIYLSYDEVIDEIIKKLHKNNDTAEKLLKVCKDEINQACSNV